MHSLQTMYQYLNIHPSRMKFKIDKPYNWLLPDEVPVCAIVSNFCLTVEGGCEIDEMFYVSVSGNICVDTVVKVVLQLAAKREFCDLL
jgi:hypothetical protein